MTVICEIIHLMVSGRKLSKSMQKVWQNCPRNYLRLVRILLGLLAKHGNELELKWNARGKFTGMMRQKTNTIHPNYALIN